MKTVLRLYLACLLMVISCGFMAQSCILHTFFSPPHLRLPFSLFFRHLVSSSCPCCCLLSVCCLVVWSGFTKLLPHIVVWLCFVSTAPDNIVFPILILGYEWVTVQRYASAAMPFSFAFPNPAVVDSLVFMPSTSLCCRCVDKSLRSLSTMTT